MKRFIVLFLMAAAVCMFYLPYSAALAASPEVFTGGEPPPPAEAGVVAEKGGEAISNDTFITSLLYVLIIVSVIILIAIGVTIIVIFVSSLQTRDQINILAESSQRLSDKTDSVETYIKRMPPAVSPVFGGGTGDTTRLTNALSAHLSQLDRVIAKLGKSETEYARAVASSLLKYEWDIIEQILKEQMNETKSDINHLADRFEVLDKYLVGNRTASIAEEIKSLTISMAVWQELNKTLEDRLSGAEAK